MTSVETIEREYLLVAVKFTRSRKPTRKAFYLGQIQALKFVLTNLVDEKYAQAVEHRIGMTLEMAKRKRA